MEKKDNSTFDGLVTGISNDERQRMLESVQKIQFESNDDIALDDEPVIESYDEIDLAQSFRQQVFIVKIICWLKSIFTHTSIEDVYNKSLVRKIVKNLETSHGNLVDYHKKSLGVSFYENFSQLKAAAEFFAPVVERYESDPGAFYMLLGSFIMNDISEAIETESDPYQYSFDKNITKEMKFSLVRKMDSILDAIPADRKTKMYACVRSMEWISQFVRLPFNNIIRRFVVTGDNVRECDYLQIKSEFGELSRILCNYTPVAGEVIQAMFYLNERKSVGNIDNLDDVNSERYTQFISNFSTQYSVIKMFVGNVPMLSLSRVVFENATFLPDSFGGGEDWLNKYKAQWQRLFEHRWEKWNRDYKIEHLKNRLSSYFGIVNFPLYPFRPWTKIVGGYEFQYEMTLGFINYFFKNEFKKIFDVLNITAVEGLFTIKENQVEFTDSLNAMSGIDDSLSALANKLSASGEYGQEFGKYEGVSVLRPKDEEYIDFLIDQIEKKVSAIIGSFGKVCRSFNNLLGGMLGKKITAYYGPLGNYTKIQGHDNKAFREALQSATQKIERAYEMTREIEPLDMPMHF